MQWMMNAGLFPNQYPQSCKTFTCSPFSYNKTRNVNIRRTSSICFKFWCKVFFELICPLCLRKVENKSLRCIDMISTATTKKKAGQNAEHQITIRFQLNRKQQAISWHLSFTSLSKILTQCSTTYHNTVCIHLTNISITKNSLHQCKKSFFSVKILWLLLCCNG